MKLVIIESPFKGATPDRQRQNVLYARLCLLDSLRRGESPLASHLLYTQVLDDANPGDREKGIAAGLAWTPKADIIAFYTDLGWSKGMLAAHENALRLGALIHTRCIPPDNSAIGQLNLLYANGSPL